MFAGCSQGAWVHSSIMWVWAPSYSHGVWARNCVVLAPGGLCSWAVTVKERKRALPLRPLIVCVSLIHKRADHARERFGRCICVGLRLCEDFSQSLSDPVFSRRAIVYVI